MVLQNKRVLSVAQSVEQKDGKPQIARSITVKVTPEESEKLSLATQEGQIVLALRSTGDDADAKTAGSNKRDLLAVAAPARKGGETRPIAAQAPDKDRGEVVHGSNRKGVEVYVGRGGVMKSRKIRGVGGSGLLVESFFFFFVWLPGAGPKEVTPKISVTDKKSMVFGLADGPKGVSVSQPAVADVVVVAPSQLLINGKAVGTTSLIVFNEKGDVSNFDLIVLPDVAALRGEFRLLLPNEKVEVATSGPSLVLKGE